MSASEAAAENSCNFLMGIYDHVRSLAERIAEALSCPPDQGNGDPDSDHWREKMITGYKTFLP